MPHVQTRFVILDEADMMLSMGFSEDVETILDSVPAERQTMLFSATMPGWVKNITRKHLNNPALVDLVGDAQSGKMPEGIKCAAIPLLSDLCVCQTFFLIASPVAAVGYGPDNMLDIQNPAFSHWPISGCCVPPFSVCSNSCGSSTACLMHVSLRISASQIRCASHHYAAGLQRC